MRVVIRLLVAFLTVTADPFKVLVPVKNPLHATIFPLSLVSHTESSGIKRLPQRLRRALPHVPTPISHAEICCPGNR